MAVHHLLCLGYVQLQIIPHREVGHEHPGLHRRILYVIPAGLLAGHHSRVVRILKTETAGRAELLIRRRRILQAELPEGFGKGALPHENKETRKPVSNICLNIRQK